VIRRATIPPDRMSVAGLGRIYESSLREGQSPAGPHEPSLPGATPGPAITASGHSAGRAAASPVPRLPRARDAAAAPTPGPGPVSGGRRLAHASEAGLAAARDAERASSRAGEEPSGSGVASTRVVATPARRTGSYPAWDEDMRSPDYRCWCGRLRGEHLNGQLCTRWLPPSRPTPAEKQAARPRPEAKQAARLGDRLPGAYPGRHEIQPQEPARCTRCGLRPALLDSRRRLCASCEETRLDIAQSWQEPEDEAC
jgi:hypothetical protein